MSVKKKKNDGKKTVAMQVVRSSRILIVFCWQVQQDFQRDSVQTEEGSQG